MAKNKTPKKEIIPEGMKKSDYADAAFRKKVTIINLCILAVFIVGVVAVIVAGWYNTKLEDERFEMIEQAFLVERDSVKAALEKIENDGGSHDDKRQVKIDVTDDTFYYWITTLDDSYQTEDEDKYGEYGGAEIHLQGMFITREYAGGAIQYWVYRQHSHDGNEKDHDHEHEHEDGALPEDMIPIEVIFQDDVEIPEDGTWVDIKGVVGPDSTRFLSAVRYAEMTIMDEPGNQFVE